MAQFSIARLLPWLSIRSKLIIAFVGLSLIPLIFVGIYSIYSSVHLIEKVALDNLSQDVQGIQENTAHFLGNVENDMMVVGNSPMLRRFLDEGLDLRSPGGRDVRSQLASELLSFVQSRQIYYQLRIINTEGEELLRIEANDGENPASGFHEIRSADLRQGGEKFYLLLSEGLRIHQIAFVPAELSDTSNARIPVISFVMALGPSPGKGRILILNAFAKSLFRVIEAKPHMNVRGTVELVDAEGHYLYHSLKKTDWNKLLASREEDNLQHDYSPAVVSELLSGSSGTITTGLQEIVSFAPLFDQSTFKNSAEPSPGLVTPLFIVESVSKDLVVGPVRSFAIAYASFLGFFFLAAIGLGLVATSQFTMPIAKLHEGAEIIATGNYEHRIQVKTHDEIEKLAEQFNRMAAALHSHEEVISRHRMGLEKTVEQRTHELTDEKSKLQAILDHVPSAFLMLDSNGRIQTASEAFTQITGLPWKSVCNKNCGMLLSENGICTHPPADAASTGEKIETHIDRMIDRQGTERYIEHTTIPIVEGGILSASVVIITDITKRKRLEEQLIQSEKLMATGEMAAIIAHEFRNALTSVKMILQLQHESTSLPEEEKKSLSVALDSIHRMEGVVTELLHFARPNPMEFSQTSVDSIIDDSISIVHLRLQRQHINLVRDVDRGLPDCLLDRQRMKDAIINLLLNAIQAIELKGKMNDGDTIRVTAKEIVLTRTLRDFQPAEDAGRGEGGERRSGTEILLRKGARCLIIGVSDTGPGIDHMMVRRIFDPFFTTKPNGTGLGLPMVKRTVNSHGGIVVVKTAKNAGASFEIVLPLIDDQGSRSKNSLQQTRVYV